MILKKQGINMRERFPTQFEAEEWLQMILNALNPFE